MYPYCVERKVYGKKGSSYVNVPVVMSHRYEKLQGKPKRIKKKLKVKIKNFKENILA